jgi:hypothetical protein
VPSPRYGDESIGDIQGNPYTRQQFRNLQTNPLIETLEDDWLEVVDVNLVGTYFCPKLVAKHMVDRGGGGKIIYISSLMAFRGPQLSAYCVSKGSQDVHKSPSAGPSVLPCHPEIELFFATTSNS